MSTVIAILNRSWKQKKLMTQHMISATKSEAVYLKILILRQPASSLEVRIFLKNHKSFHHWRQCIVWCAMVKGHVIKVPAKN